MTESEGRIPPIPFAQWSEEARTTLPRHLQRPELFEAGGGDRPMPGVFRQYAHHPRLAEPWLLFSDALMTDALLDPRLRELVVLRVSWRTGSAYEWHQHLRIAQQYGLLPEHVQAVIDGPEAASWTSFERALILAADELIDRTVVSDRTWEELRQHLDDAQLMELLFVVGAYVCNAMVLNSVGLRPEPSSTLDVPPIPPPGVARDAKAGGGEP